MSSPFLSWGFHPIVSYSKFSELALKLREELDGFFHKTCSGGFVPILLVVSTLVANFLCPSSRYFLAALLGDHCWYLSYFLKGAPKFLYWLLHDGEQFPGKYSPFLMVLLLLDTEGLMWRSSLLSDGCYFLLSHFLLLCTGGEVKTEVNVIFKDRLAIFIWLLTHNIR